MILAVLSILAQTGLTRRQEMELLRQGFLAEPHNNALTNLAVGVAIVVAILALAVKAFRSRPTTEPGTPDWLALACAHLGISDADRRDLVHLAKLSGAAQPLAMILSPANLRHAFEVANLPGADGALAKRLNDLSLTLFGKYAFPELAPLPTRKRDLDDPALRLDD